MGKQAKFSQEIILTQYRKLLRSLIMKIRMKILSRKQITWTYIHGKFDRLLGAVER